MGIAFFWEIVQFLELRRLTWAKQRMATQEESGAAAEPQSMIVCCREVCWFLLELLASFSALFIFGSLTLGPLGYCGLLPNIIVSILLVPVAISFWCPLC